MSTHIETVVIGGGQAGLAVSYYLSQQDRPHIVLEQALGMTQTVFLRVTRSSLTSRST